jgi:hypothetical protein
LHRLVKIEWKQRARKHIAEKARWHVQPEWHAGKCLTFIPIVFVGRFRASKRPVAGQSPSEIAALAASRSLSRSPIRSAKLLRGALVVLTGIQVTSCASRIRIEELTEDETLQASVRLAGLSSRWIQLK